MKNGVYKLRHKHLNDVYYRCEAHNGIYTLYAYNTGELIKQYSFDNWLKEHCINEGLMTSLVRSYDLVWMYNGVIREKLVTNSTYPVCNAAKRKTIYAGTHKSGMLVIIQNDKRIPAHRAINLSHA